VENQLSNSVLSGQAVRSLEDVPAENRAVLNLHYLEEMSIGETAQVLGIPVGTAKSRLARGIQKLKSLLNERPLKGMVL
jgi:RNA polymerase sigma-70 factor (ECF subfamily)